MQGDDRLRRGVVQDTRCDHGGGPARAFLGGLEVEGDATRQILEARQELREPERDGHMRVVPACMRQSLALRPVALAPLGFRDGQRVHVGADADAPFAAADHGNNAGAAHAAVLDAQAVELGFDVGRCLVLGERELRVAVDDPAMPPQHVGELQGVGPDGGCCGVSRHAHSPPGPRSR